MSHGGILLFKTLISMLFGSKKSCLKAKFGFKIHCLSNSFHSSMPRSLRKQLFKIVKYHIVCVCVGGGGSKSGKKVSRII